MHMRHIGAVTAAIVVLLSAAPPATAVADRPPASLIAALKRDLGLDPVAAQQRLAQEQAAIKLQDVLVADLGAAYAGSWFDAGKLAVAVDSPAAAEHVRARGAVPHVVARRLADLTAIQSALDTLARKDPASQAGVAAWGIDHPTNTVVLTLLKGQPTGGMVELARSYGAAVRMETVTTPPVATGQYLDGGEKMSTWDSTHQVSGCSAGLNLRHGDGSGWMFTAGHCAGGTEVTGFDGTRVGTWGEAYFPGRDYGLVSVEPGYWVQGPWISAHTPEDAVYRVVGAIPTLLHGTVCKSGITTRITCGVITRVNESVRLDTPPRHTINHLTRYSACTEKGDSGGPVFAPVGLTAYVDAQGVQSSSRLADGRCLAKVGGQNESWFQTLSVLPWYPELRLLTTRNSG